ncbi:unnamed protein product [Acanthosepion pharaonis]|uniref:Uncharacterized protein n=1 Tax=Acanthosepion pharaonis TaxID=158019 RepID=A0A812AK63_ACAPH|nr:unnamed protein product [Sepia pharaonis]
MFSRVLRITPVIMCTIIIFILHLFHSSSSLNKMFSFFSFAFILLSARMAISKKCPNFFDLLTILRCLLQSWSGFLPVHITLGCTVISQEFVQLSGYKLLPESSFVRSFFLSFFLSFLSFVLNSILVQTRKSDDTHCQNDLFFLLFLRSFFRSSVVFFSFNLSLVHSFFLSLFFVSFTFVSLASFVYLKPPFFFSFLFFPLSLPTFLILSFFSLFLFAICYSIFFFFAY